MTEDTTHECPKNGCTRRVSHQYLACRAHWQQVSKPTQALVYATFANDLDAYLEARADAIEEMNSR